MILYRVLISVFALVLAIKLLVRRDGAGLRARFGRMRPASDTPYIWLHAASNGELMSLRAVIDGLLARDKNARLLITCNSQTGVALAQSWGQGRIQAELAPLDLRWCVRNVHQRFRVTAHLTVESEIWPNRMLTCNGPVVVVGGRLSDGTLKGFRWLGGFGRRAMGRIALLSAQDPKSEANFLAAGVRPSALAPQFDLKAQYQPPLDMVPDAALKAAFDRAQTWLAASTHPGEEEIIAEAHRAYLAQNPAAQLILAPRHARRGDEVAALLRKAGFAVAQRSKGDAPQQGAVYLVDTMGEMPLWYALAGRVFMGGSFVPVGGHTPYEPAYFAQAILHGPDTSNQAAAYAALHKANAAVCVKDSKELAEALLGLQAPEKQRMTGICANKAISATHSANELLVTLDAILPKR
ncbi:3-deoxy-D-manno-octulosonic acid transferase [Pseudoprimorskyibacter insulae]|uniref:3-deoxy-D-manno-octulosonic acid transferase n=1 Tax=Pseudoprimorskyibacter insulae TaxID=1695997 RepID=A0A2R8AQR7_9RHOB|nr:glycosyltransferase N-terminal domain-containing protein [Pseudoprimorskyibacter insulae]SPF78217.1 3-deoxy-D-manno-octulosonic acid transferase [Pseudoprimorskyibacter insulae]